VIVEEGAAGSEMFIIEDGEVEIVRSRGGVERVLWTLGPGEFFGEMSVLERRPRNATARAKGACRLLAIDATTLDALLREYPDVAVRMMRKLSGRLREFEEQEERAALAAMAGISPKKEKAPTSDSILDKPISIHGETPLAGFYAPEIAKAAAELVSIGRLEHSSGWSFAAEADGEFLVGRVDPVTQVAPPIDLGALDTERTLSRRHARFSRRLGRYYLREEPGTANGTWVGADRLSAGAERELSDGDTMRFGRIDLVFRVVRKS
jgi:CRP-like cAMP-binding protein